MNNARIIAGIPSRNNQDTIQNVATVCGKALEKLEKPHLAAIVNTDGASSDNTVINFLKAKTNVQKRVLVQKKDQLGKGNGLRLFFKAAKVTKATTIMVNDSDLRSINVEWVKLQAKAIKQGYDLATPFYSRYKYDGQITNHVCYPLMYGLFGYDIRQPIGGDFAFSRQVMNYWLKKKWSPNVKKFGIDIFMTSNAVLGGFKVCQVNLKSKVHDPKDPAASLGPMTYQVLNSIFSIINQNKSQLKDISKVKKAPMLGGDAWKNPEAFKVSANASLKLYNQGKKKYASKYQKVLGSQIKLSNDLDADTWSHIVYKMIKAYEKDKSAIDQIIPLWYGRIYSFINETKSMSSKQAERVIKDQCKVFFDKREELFK